MLAAEAVRREFGKPLGVSFVASAAEPIQAQVAVIGDSLVSGYKLRRSDAYPSQLEKLLRRHRYNVNIDNYGRSGDTITGGMRRLDKIPVENYHLIMIVLGGNDMLRGKTPPGVSQANFDNIIRRIRERNPKAHIILGGMKAHSGHPKQYRDSFNNMYVTLSRKYNVGLYPFILQGVYGEDTFMLPDTIHPNARGTGEMANRTAPMVARALNSLFR